MSKELATNQMCLLLKNRIEIWLTQDELKKLGPALERNQFITIHGEMIARSEIAGIFKPQTIVETKYIAEGKWKCMKGNWHDRGTFCECKPPEQLEKEKSKREEFYKLNGYYPLPPTPLNPNRKY